MPKTFCCEICCFQTEKKSTYTNHLKSDKHIKKVNGVASTTASETSSVSSLTNNIENNSFTASRIRELEHQLQLKDAEIQRMKIEYELKSQHKDEIIALLKQQPPAVQIQPKNNVDLIVQEKPQKGKINLIPAPQPQPIQEETGNEMKGYRNNAINIETFIDNYIKNPNEHKLTMISHYKNKPITIPKYVNSNELPSNIKTFYVNTICNLLNKIPMEKRPIFCSDERRKTFYIKTNGTWVNDINTVNKFIEQLVMEIKSQILTSIQTLDTLIPKKPPCYAHVKELLNDGDEQNKLGTLSEELKNAQQYDKEYCLFGDWFKSLYNMSIEKYIGIETPTSHKQSLIIFHFQMDRDLIPETADKLTSKLNEMTCKSPKHYKALKDEPAVKKCKSEDEYDCEQDDDYI